MRVVDLTDEIRRRRRRVREVEYDVYAEEDRLRHHHHRHRHHRGSVVYDDERYREREVIVDHRPGGTYIV